MKLIIDIPEVFYEYCKAQEDAIEIQLAVKNGIPLDKVRAEIDQKQYDFMADKDYDEGIRFGLMLAYQIIDKYRESEE